MKKYVIFLLLTISAVQSWSSDLFTSLKEVYESNPQILSEREKVKKTEANLGLAKTGWYPSVSMTGGISKAKTKLDKLGNNDSYTQKQYGISASENIFHGFSTNAQIEAAKSQLTAEEANLYATEQDVFLAAINAYINVLDAKEVLNLKKHNEKVLKEYYDLYQEKEKFGVLTKTDVTQAKARLEAAKYSVIDAKAKYDNSLETYRRIYGKVEDKYKKILLKKDNAVFPKNIEEAEKLALAKHPAILAMNAQEKAAEANITVAKQTIMPSVDIMASSFKVDDVPSVQKATDSRIGIYLTVPLYDKGITFSKTKQAKAEKEEIKIQGIQVKRLVLERLRQAWNLYQANLGAIKSAEARVGANKSALIGVRDEQERGRRTVLDVLNAEQELLDSKVTLIQAEHAKISAYFSVLSGMGQLNIKNLE